MAKNTLYNKIWNLHKVGQLRTGQDQIFIGLHYMHEVTSPQAFAMLREKHGVVKYPNRHFATMDHIVPTDCLTRPFIDSQAELMAKTIEENTRQYGITFFDMASQKQGVVHIIGPEYGLTQPGMTIACGDSHTSTHGAFGSLAFGIGTTEVLHILETQTLALSPLKVRKVLVSGVLPKGVFAKDVILKIIQTLGVNGGIGYAYEYSGDVFANMSMEARMTVCNMSIEGGARIGYINPDQVTFDYLKNRMYAPKGDEYDRAVHYWKSVASDSHAVYDDVVRFSAKDITPMITWGINPAQAISIDGVLPKLDLVSDSDRKAMELAYSYMKLTPGKPILGTPVDVVFIGSCTNGRIEDLRLAASVLKGKKVKIKCLVVPGSYQVKAQAEAEGLDDIFKSAGALWRFPGCSMCLAMNPDKLVETQISASTSNRNFMGRQGSPTGRTMLVSPVSAAAIAIEGKVADPRSYL